MSTSIQTLRENESRGMGFALVESMCNMGLKRDTERGIWPVRFRHIFVLEDERGIHRHNVYVVDAQRLPVRTSQIADRSMLGTLSAVARRPVFVDPEFELAGIRYGFSLVVEMTPRQKPQRLPDHVALPDELPPDRLAFGVGPDGLLALTRREIRGLVVAGAPRSGKSTLLRSLAFQCVTLGWQVYLADPIDSGTFVPELWRRFPTVAGIAQTQSSFAGVIACINDECSRRADLFRQAAPDGIPPEDLEAYNAGAPKPLPPLVLIVDEFNTFTRNNEFIDLARRGQKHGMLIVLGAHNWRSDDIPRALSELLQSRICYRVNSKETARAVFPDCGGAIATAAVRIDRPGRALVSFVEPIHQMQTYHVEPDRIMALAHSRSASDITRQVELTANERTVAEAVMQRGHFSYSKLQGVLSNRQLRRIALSWSENGWLDPETAEGRPLSRRFYEQTGISRPGAQGDQRGDHRGDQAPIIGSIGLSGMSA